MYLPQSLKAPRSVPLSPVGFLASGWRVPELLQSSLKFSLPLAALVLDCTEFRRLLLLLLPHGMYAAAGD